MPLSRYALFSALLLLPGLASAFADLSLSAQYQNQLVHYAFDGDGIDDGLYMTDGGTGDDVHGANHGRLNISGQRSLSGGLSAHFGVHSNIGALGVDEAGGGLAAREVFAGLRGHWGLVRAGRLGTPYATAAGDPLDGTFLQGRGNGGRLGLADGLGNGGYRDGVVRYDHRLGGYAVAAALLLDDAEGDTAHALVLRLDAPLGPASLWLAATAANGYGGHGSTDAATEWGGTLMKLGTALSGRLVTVVLEYEHYATDPAGGAEPAGDREHLFASVRFNAGNDLQWVLNLGTETEQGTDYAALAWLREVGDRTRLHAGVRRTDNASRTTAIGTGLRLAF